jgi:hypothetical protein
MRRLLLLSVFVLIPSAWSAESVSQRTSAPCSPVVSGVKGNVDITIINCRQGVDPAMVKRLLRLLNEGLPRMEEQQRQIIELLGSRLLDTKQLEELMAAKYAAVFSSSREDAAKWAKELVESSKANEAEIKSLALSEKELTDKLTLKLKPLGDFVFQEFDSRISELTKRGLIYPQQFTPDDSKIEFIVFNKQPQFNLMVRDIEFKNGGGIHIYLDQGQVRSGKLIREPRFYIGEIVDGVRRYAPYIRLLSKELTLHSEKTDKITTHKPKTDDPLGDEEFRHKISTAIADSISFIYLRDAASSNPRPPPKLNSR